METETPKNEPEPVEEIATKTETAEETPKISDEEIAELRKRADLADNYKKRAEKAEKEAKASKPKAPSQDDLSSRDVLYLAKADIHEDDLQEVLDTAKQKGITMSDAHKYLKPILDVRQQERTTALATQTGRGMRGANKTSGEDLLRKAERTGEVPTDDAGLRALAEARLARKKAGNS